jgi:glycosyltransferase involved in cell wall biosynthesis
MPFDDAQSLRVAVFTDANLDSTSGMTTTLKALVAHGPQELRSRIYTFSDLEVDEPHYRAIHAGWLARLRTVRHELLRDEVETVHITTPGASGLVGRYVAGQIGLPLVGSVDNSGFTGRPRLTSRYLRWMYSPCHQILLPSQESARRFTASGWCAKPPLVWPRGVDARVYSPDQRSDWLREKWHVSHRRPAILVGRLSPEKGVALLEPLSSLLHRQRIAHRFIVMGSGPLLPALRERCPDALFTGPIAASEVAQVMASADVLWHPGETTSGCSVVLEAQACGLPVVVAATGSARENMLPGRTGLVCRAGDVDEFAVRLGQLLVDPDRRRTMGEAARTYARERSWQRSFATLCRAYREARARRPVRQTPALTTLSHHRSAGPR